MYTEPGCYADGCFGHDHIRAVMATMLTHMFRHQPRGGDGIYWEEVEPITERLLEDPSDDFGEEDDAIHWLNKMCATGLYFTMLDGDFVLIHEDEEYG